MRVEKFKIWLAWLCGGIIWLMITNATKHLHIVSVITQVLLVVFGVLFTIAAVSMTRRLNRKDDEARKEILGGL
ncbi:hypothetical protein [Streptomyces sp. NPDC006446]|uniref:hypothetical protein n=1 Tax=Streptomyces sp. NPDC006446 TaxID=3154301 RepID=UPI0033B669DB